MKIIYDSDPDEDTVLVDSHLKSFKFKPLGSVILKLIHNHQAIKEKT